MKNNLRRHAVFQLWRIVFLISLLALSSLACDVNLGSSAQTPESITPSSDDMVSLFVPLYNASLEPGHSVPMTQMTYLNRDGFNYNVTLDGLAATKRVGDSFSWKGVIGPGIIARYNLRIAPSFSVDNMIVAGPVELTILNPVPVELGNSPDAALGDIHFTNIAISHQVSKGEKIPGTTLVFEGLAEDGALLSGTEGYPYRALGDSLIWTGRLRGNTIARFSLNVSGLNEDQMSLLGTAEIWISSSS